MGEPICQVVSHLSCHLSFAIVKIRQLQRGFRIYPGCRKRESARSPVHLLLECYLKGKEGYV